MSHPKKAPKTVTSLPCLTLHSLFVTLHTGVCKQRLLITVHHDLGTGGSEKSCFNDPIKPKLIYLRLHSVGITGGVSS